MKPSYPIIIGKIGKQRGSMMLEALIAILIFSMGILAIVGMQAASVKQANDAKYRIEANFLVNEVIGQMWISNRTPAILQANFATGGPAYTAWLADVQATLPGASGANAPTITIVQVPGTNPPTTTTSIVTVQVFWVAPGETVPHNHLAITQIK